MSSMWGESLKISVFGASHSKSIGVTVDGLPAGEKIDMEQVLVQMSRRAPGQSETATSRKEADFPVVISGLRDDGTITGDPLCAMIENTNTRSKDYSEFEVKPRPGHADYTAHIKYSGYNDIRGGGHFSGRLTAPMVFAGALCRQILKRKGISVAGHILSVNNVFDEELEKHLLNDDILYKLNESYFPVISDIAKEKMISKIGKAKAEGDSVGGIVECAITGMPVGLGHPIFSGIESVLSGIIFAVPAVKGVEFGSGFKSTYMYGSENNDEFYYDKNGKVKTITNNAGGILGGITNGMPLIVRAALKPTPSIFARQNTVNLKTKHNDVIEIKGRHDPCIVPRAAVAIESVCAIAIMDLVLKAGESFGK